MLPLVEIPVLVRHFASYFESLFSPEAFVHFQRYISGLVLSENKTVDGINRIFVTDTRHQSSLNRWLNASPFSVEALHQARLALLGDRKGTAIKPKGVLSLDDTLLTHYGHHFDKIAKLFDHVSGSYVWAHNLVNLHYSDDQTDYPISFQLWEPAEVEVLEAGLKDAGIRLRDSKYALKESDPKKWRSYLVGVWSRHQKKEAVAQIYQSKLMIGQRLVRQFFADHPSLQRHLPVTFDSWYTQPSFCQFLDETLHVAYVGTLCGDETVQLAKGPQRVDAFADHLQEEHHQAIKDGPKKIFRKITIPYKGEEETYYSYCQTHRLENFGKQRLVINHRQEDLSDTATFYISNRRKWTAKGITRIRRHRWPVEVYHEEGKVDGLDQYQVRDFEAIGKHVALVAVTYSILRAAQHDTALLRQLHQDVQITLDGSAGACRRNTQAQALWALAGLIQTGLTQGHTLKQVMQPVLAAVSY
jgi:DDE superfamily endonuclease